jgi:hypothetical protein
MCKYLSKISNGHNFLQDLSLLIYKKTLLNNLLINTPNQIKGRTQNRYFKIKIIIYYYICIKLFGKNVTVLYIFYFA